MADKGTPAANPITELKVSGHAMKLEPGLYCVFNAPDSPVPSGQTGLPGVRISSAPGIEGGRVEIAGFEANGWIGADAAALIRVSNAPASVVVTVYQEPDTQGEAPKLQVVTLSSQAAPAPRASKGPRAAAPQPAAQAPASQSPALQSPAAQPIEVMAHIYSRGDVGGRLSNWIGEPGSNLWIEGFAVAPSGVPASDLEYQAVLGRGWLSPWAEGGQFCGSRGMSLPILGLRVKLRGNSARTHQVQLTASFVDGTRIGPVHDGDACEAPSLAALEAFQIAIVPAVQPAAPTRGKAPAIRRAPAKAPPAITARAPVPVPTPARAKAKAKPVAKPAKVQAPTSAPASKPGKAKATMKPAVKPSASTPARAAPAPARTAPARTAPTKRAPTTRRR